MSRIVVTAQLLTDLHRAGKQIVLPKDALITPAARDWMKEHAVPIEWKTGSDANPTAKLAAAIDLGVATNRSILLTLERAFGTVEVIDPSEKAGGCVLAVRKLCAAVAGGKLARGLIFADDAALPLCLANKQDHVRAPLGTSVSAVEDAARQLAINVLVIEPSRQTIHQVRQMVDRFCKTKPTDAATAALEAIAQTEAGHDANR